MDTFDESTVDYHDAGTMNFKCLKCEALMFKGEQSKKAKFTLCCSDGAVRIPPVKEPPQILKQLLTGNTNRDKDFRQSVRAYNSSLAFASMCLTGMEFTFKTKGPYCYRINGQVYHAISQIEPEFGRKPGFSQIYIYDDQIQLENRLNVFNSLDASMLKDLQDMMTEINPYAQKYRHIGNVIKEKPATDIRLVLRSTGKAVDPRRYNLPTGTDIAVVIPTNPSNLASRRDVVVYKSAVHHPTGQSLQYINTEHPMYDPLVYVLMFPYGDKGWELGSYTSANRKSEKCSPMQYYLSLIHI